MKEYSDYELQQINAFNRYAKPLKQPAEFRDMCSEGLADERECFALFNATLENVTLMDAESRSLVWLARFYKENDHKHRTGVSKDPQGSRH